MWKVAVQLECDAWMRMLRLQCCSDSDDCACHVQGFAGKSLLRTFKDAAGDSPVICKVSHGFLSGGP